MDALSKPDVSEWLVWIWRAWHRLTADRPWHGGGFGPAFPGAIPWQTVISYGIYHDYDDQQIELLDHCIREMDKVFMQHHAAKVADKK